MGVELGARVRFSHYYERPTFREIQDDGGEERISLQLRINPKPERVGVVVGVTRLVTSGEIFEDEDSYARAMWHDGQRETFYAVRLTLRGRRYFTKAGAMERAESA